MKIFIAIPTRGQPSIAFAESLAVTVCALTLAKAEVTIYHHQANNFVCMSRNKLIAEFLKTDCTHIWFVDDDMGWNADAVLKMIAADVPFVAGIGPLKTDSGEDFACNLFSNPDGSTVIKADNPDFLMSAQFVGGAFLILKRAVIEMLIKIHPELKSIAVDPEHGYHLFESKYQPLWMTEDYVFCDRWRALGGEIWCFPNISFTHQGIKDWKGNYFEYRVEHGKKSREAKPETAPEVPENIKRMLCQSYVDRKAVRVSTDENINRLFESVRIQ